MIKKELEEMPSVPTAPPITMQQAVNPIPHLLLSFPVPQLAVPTRVPRPHVDPTAEQADATNTTQWSRQSMQRVATGMAGSAQQLIQSGQFSRFLQEELHREVQSSPAQIYKTTKCPPRSSGSHMDADSNSASSSSSMSTSAAVSFLEKEVSAAVKQHLSVAAPQVSIDRPAALVASKSDSWVRSPEKQGGMHLRPRNTLPVKRNREEEEEKQQHEQAAPARTRTTTRQKKTTSPPPPTSSSSAKMATATTTMVDGSLHSSSGIMGAEEDDVVLEVIEKGGKSCTVAVLQRFMATVLIRTGCLRGVALDRLTLFLSSLLQNELPAAATAAATPAQHWEIAVRGLACVTCLACPSFDPSATPDGLIDRLISVFGTTARLVGQELTQHASSANTDADGKLPLGKEALAWVEVLRAYLQGFAVIVSHRSLNLVTDTCLVRLEDICYQCLFTVPHRAEKMPYAVYASYVADSAIHAYRSVWNRLEVQRNVTAERFFPRLLLSTNISQRTVTFCEGRKKVMPLSLAVLAAAQSTPVYADTVSHQQAERLQKQCTIWSGCLIQQLLDEHHKDEKEYRDLSWLVFTQMMEDLTELIGAPEWPAADMLLRSCVLALSHRYLQWSVPPAGEGKDTSSSTTATAAAASAHADSSAAVLAVDTIAQVALRLLDPSNSPLVLDDAADTAAPAALLQEWQTITLPPQTRSKTSNATTGRRGGGVRVDASSSASSDKQSAVGKHTTELPMSAQAVCAMYYTISHYMEKHAAAVDQASLWFHTRAAMVYHWHLCSSSSSNGVVDLIPECALDKLVRATAVPDGGLAMEWGSLRALIRHTSSQMDKSMLSQKMQRTLISILLSVFHARDAHGEAVMVANDVVLKKTLQHLSRLTDLVPPLQRLVWPIARQCVRDDSARVRESSVALLAALLHSASNKLTKTMSVDEEGLVTDIVSSFLHLLEDKSVAVVCRTVAALDSLLTDKQYRWLLATEKGAALLSFVQFKLLALVAPSAEKRPRTEVSKLFLKRWVNHSMQAEQGQDAASVVSAHHQLAKELMDLAVLGSPDYPHEVAVDDHPLVRLLHNMRQQVVAAMGTPGRRRGKNTVELHHLQHAMRSAARSLWNQYHASTTAEEAIPCLAALHALAAVDTEWAEQLADGLLGCLEYPPPPASPLSTHAEFGGGAVLQACHILHSLLSSPTRVPTLSLEALSRALISLLSKYVGPFQQRIILASCKALTSLITCGAKHNALNQTYLILCYSLMNTYYVQARALLPELSKSAQHVSYMQRFLFLLSQLLRCYAGWRQPPSMLKDEAVTKGFSQAPNLLAQGSGICLNVYNLVMEVLQRCDEEAKKKVSLVAMRVLTSLCMLEPAVFFYRSEPHLREALSMDADTAHHVQGLTLIRDFLVEEDRRVDMAARMLCNNRPPAAVDMPLSDDAAEEDAVESGPHRTGLKQAPSKPACPTTKSPSASSTSAMAQDQNSGMSTWVMQRFHGNIVNLTESGQTSVRSVCLDILQLAAQGGLLPPMKFLDAVMAVAADVNTSLRQRAVQLLCSHADRHLDVIASLSSRGVQFAYKLHHACGVNLLQSAYTFAGGDPFGVELSSHAALFSLFNKRHRENFVTTLTRFFFQESKALAWCSEFYASSTTPAAEALLFQGDAVFKALNPITFLAHLTAVLAFCPFSHESDVVHVVQQCRIGIDLQGQSALDYITEVLQTQKTAAEPPHRQDLSALWRSVGVMMLVYLRRALRSEYKLTPLRLRRYMVPASGPIHHTPLGSREPKSRATLTLLASLSEIVQKTSCLLAYCASNNNSNGFEDARNDSAWAAGWSFLATELAAALLEEGAEDVFGAHQQKKAAADGGAVSVLKRRGRGRQESDAVGSGRPRRRRHDDAEQEDADDAEVSSSSAGSSSSSSTEQSEDESE